MPMDVDAVRQPSRTSNPVERLKKALRGFDSLPVRFPTLLSQLLANLQLVSMTFISGSHTVKPLDTRSDTCNQHLLDRKKGS